MTNHETLSKAIELAIERGYRYDNSTTDFTVWETGNEPIYLIEIGGWPEVNVEAIIYSHDFAKALFGEYHQALYKQHYIPARGYPGESNPKNKVKIDSTDEADWKCTRCGKKWSRCFDTNCNLITKGNMGWETHLQRMVTADDPIEYLAANIEAETNDEQN